PLQDGRGDLLGVLDAHDRGRLVGAHGHRRVVLGVGRGRGRVRRGGAAVDVGGRRPGVPGGGAPVLVRTGGRRPVRGRGTGRVVDGGGVGGTVPTRAGGERERRGQGDRSGQTGKFHNETVNTA